MRNRPEHNIEKKENESGRPVISVVIPCYRCSPYLAELCSRLQATLSDLVSSYEIIFVEDASPMDDWAVIEQLSQRYRNVKAFQLSRNFGQHSAITAGLDVSLGEWVVVMDGDLQDEPEDIAALYKRALEGFDTVIARRSARGDSFYRKTVSYIFFAFLSYLTNIPQDPNIGNFGIYHRRVIRAVCLMRETMRCFPAMVRWVGFRSSICNLARKQRVGTGSSYSFSKLVALGLDIAIAFSDKPLMLCAKLGFLLSVTSGTGILTIILLVLAGKVGVPGWASLMVTTCFLGGLIIFLLGVVGIYVGRVFGEAKGRPLYVVRQSLTSLDNFPS